MEDDRDRDGGQQLGDDRGCGLERERNTKAVIAGIFFFISKTLHSIATEEEGQEQERKGKTSRMDVVSLIEEH